MNQKIVACFFCVLLCFVSGKLFADPGHPETGTWTSERSCSSFIDTSFIETTIENCDIIAVLCLEASFSDMITYTITDNGNPYTGGINACDFDTSYAYTYFGLPGGGLAGPYMVDNWSVDGNLHTGQVNAVQDLVDSMNVWDPTGGWSIDEPTSSIRGGLTTTTYSNLDIIQISSGTLESIELTTSLIPNGVELSLDTGYHELIFTEPVDGCLDTIIAVINCVPCSSFYSGQTGFELDNCDEAASICLDIPFDDILNFSITDNGFAYSSAVQPCNPDTLCSYDYSSMPGGGTTGPYLLQSWTINGSVFIGGFNTVTELVDSMNVWDAGTAWILNETQQQIETSGCTNTYGNLQVLQILSGSTATLVFDQSEYYQGTGLILDAGTHNLELTNNNNFCTETIDFQIDCNPCIPVFDGTPVGLEAVHCDSATAICLALPFAVAGDYSWTVNGAPYTGGFSGCGTGETAIQLDTGQYHLVITHTLLGCQDSVDITISCVPDIPCLDFIAQDFVLLSVNDCESPAGFCVEIAASDMANYTITDNGIPYAGSISSCNGNPLETSLEIGTGTHEILFVDNASNCGDTVNVEVICITSSTENTTVLVNETEVFCPDVSELPGNIVSIENTCPENSGELVLFETDNTTFCVDYTGMEAGTETACIVICDHFGFCDTTFVNVTTDAVTIEPDPLPIARNDSGEVLENNTVELGILDNDDINGALDAVYLTGMPSSGTATISDDHHLVYVPVDNYCNSLVPDEMSYAVCNEFGCDTAQVSIRVLCRPLKAFSGFSPNNDGKNDYFVIAGLQQYPDHELFIFNKWGARVLKTKNYQNDWDGTWEGKTLPDGTYFYVFDNGKGDLITGYVQIER